MGTTFKEGANFDRKVVGAGVKRGVCVWIIDIGTETTPFFNKDGSPKKQPKILVGWELPDERIEFEGQTHRARLSKKYTLSADQRANLRQDLEAWLGKPFTEEECKTGVNLKSLLGKNCLLNVIHEERAGKVYANVSSIMGLPQGMAEVTPESPQLFFDMDLRTPLPSGLPPFVVTWIAKSPEWAERYAVIEGGLSDACHDATTDLPDDAPGAISSGNEVILEGEARRLGKAAGKTNQAVDIAVGTAKRHGTLALLVAEWLRQKNEGPGPGIDWMKAPGTTQEQPPASAALSAPAAATPFQEMIDNLYDLGEVLGMKAREIAARVATVEAAGPQAIEGLHRDWTKQVADKSSGSGVAA